MAYANEAADRPMTFMDQVNDTGRHANELDNRLRALAGRLCGPTPPEPASAAGGGKLQSVPNGVFAEVHDAARQTYSAIQSAHDSLSRIERALP